MLVSATALAKPGAGTSWNRAATYLFGYRPDEIVGQKFLRLIPAARSAEAHTQLDDVLYGPEVEPYDTERVRQDGTVVDVSMTVSYIRDSRGDVVGGAVVSTGPGPAYVRWNFFTDLTVTIGNTTWVRGGHM